MDYQGRGRSSTDGDVTMVGKPTITMTTPWGVSPPPPCATDTHTAHSGVTFNPTKLPSQIEIQTLKKKKEKEKLLLGKKASPKHLVGLSYINIKSPHLTLSVKGKILIL